VTIEEDPRTGTRVRIALRDRGKEDEVRTIMGCYAVAFEIDKGRIE
jgi:hypothetical protein